MADADSITITWHVEDVLLQAQEDGVPLSREEARTILQEMGRLHDPSEGITWSHISNEIARHNCERNKYPHERM